MRYYQNLAHAAPSFGTLDLYKNRHVNNSVRFPLRWRKWRKGIWANNALKSSHEITLTNAFSIRLRISEIFFYPFMSVGLFVCVRPSRQHLPLVR